MLKVTRLPFFRKAEICREPPLSPWFRRCRAVLSHVASFSTTKRELRRKPPNSRETLTDSVYRRVSRSTDVSATTDCPCLPYQCRGSLTWFVFRALTPQSVVWLSS